MHEGFELLIYFYHLYIENSKDLKVQHEQKFRKTQVQTELKITLFSNLKRSEDTALIKVLLGCAVFVWG